MGGGGDRYCYIQRSFNDTGRIKCLLLIRSKGMPMTNGLFILKKKWNLIPLYNGLKIKHALSIAGKKTVWSSSMVKHQKALFRVTSYSV